MHNSLRHIGTVLRLVQSSLLILIFNMILLQGTNGSQLWDTAFVIQAFLEVSCVFYRILSYHVPRRYNKSGKLCTIMQTSVVMLTWWQWLGKLVQKFGQIVGISAKLNVCFTPFLDSILFVVLTYRQDNRNTVFDLISVLFAYVILGQQNRPN